MSLLIYLPFKIFIDNIFLSYSYAGIFSVQHTIISVIGHYMWN